MLVSNGIKLFDLHLLIFVMCLTLMFRYLLGIYYLQRATLDTEGALFVPSGFIAQAWHQPRTQGM